jgi:hypothetical protein
LKEQIAKATDEKKMAEIKADLEGWRAELERFQGLLPVEAKLSSLKDIELPDLEKQLEEQKARLPGFSSDHENVSEADNTYLKAK